MEKQLLYFKNFIDNLENYQKEEGKEKDTVKKLVFYGVKTINRFHKEQNETLETVIERFQLISFINSIIGLLTPNEFVNIFPIFKEYKGHKWEMKDYFYTKRYIDSLDKDKPIGTEEEVFNFLWEYHNWDITEFMVENMSCISDLRRLEGQPSLIEEWASDNGIKTYTMHEDDKGNKFLIDKEGKTTKVSKPRPRYLKVVK
ncbi:hypothetical protein CIW83_18210 [Tissierella sp. P1]|uniref:hypothetical protein n=1 Tax=Tissierella sp. P1 TaxID=1280483 RepID=UPI000B9FEF81|nr:hypothetical protein [Tissierella sp. P1]OZV10755.1 hypothetical protein CIW83_18210 [Tissierella sp. P1]